MKVAEFLPPVILEKDREKPWMEWAPGTVLFADVSGFTPMSEALSVLGAEGGEVLTDILNRYFAAMIGIVHAHGGQVMKFGGDAILCFFPEAGGWKPETGEMGGTRNSKLETRNCGALSLHQALRAASLMQAEMPRFQNIKTPVKRFALKMKIGLAHGECLLAGVGDPSVRCDYVFAGAPVDATSDAEHHAVAGEIVFAGDKCKLQNARCKMEEVEPGFWRILEVPREGEAANKESVLTPSALSHQHSASRSYLIAEVHDLVAAGHGEQAGALLDIVPVFLKFSGFTYTRESFDLPRFHEFFSSVMEVTHRHGGRLNRISMGDKGSTFFILFGAPNPLEKKEELACQWALDLKETAVARFPDVTIGAGMNAGRVFAGIVGGGGRSEYTVMGDAVNFAARLMQGARDGQACLSAEVRNRAGGSFSFEDLGARRFKGKAESLVVFALEERRRGGAADESATLVGRQDEAALILDMMDRARNGEPSLCVIEGEPGVGKSCLAGHILGKARGDGWRVAMGRGEITRRSHAYSPWKDALETLFFGEGGPDAGLLRSLVPDEFTVYLPWHLEFVGLPVTGELVSPEHDEETRKRLFQHQLSVMVMELAAAGPVLLFLDDLHWLDTLSMELLTALLNHFKGQSVFILATARPGWEKKEFESRPACRFLPLESMQRPDVRGLAEAMLGGRVREDLVEFVFERGKGNPFFTRQVLEYLKAENLLETRLGEWIVKREAQTKGVPGSEGLVLAQVGRLSAEAQAHLKMAACIGPTFELPVLKDAMGNRFRKRALNALLRAGLLRVAGENALAFPHALIQETLYAAIPQRSRRLQHRRIGWALEGLHGDDLQPYYPNLANHFFLGAIRSKAGQYCVLAGESKFRELAFPEAVIYFGRAATYFTCSNRTKQLAILFKLAKCYLKVGRAQDCIRLIPSYRRNAKASHDPHAVVHAVLFRCDALQMLGDYSYIRAAETTMRSSKAILPEQMEQLHYLIGVGYFRKGRYDEAKVHFEYLVNSRLEYPEYQLLARIPLAGVAKTRGEFAKAIKVIDDGIQFAAQVQKPYQLLRLEIEKAGIMMDAGRHDDAMQLLPHCMTKAEQFGDYYLVGVVCMNMGILTNRKLDAVTASMHLQEAKDIFQRIGAMNALAKSTMELGISNYYLREYSRAHQLYLEATQVLEHIEEIQDACHGYYNLAEVCVELGRMDEARKWYEAGIKAINPKDYPQIHREFMELRHRIIVNDNA